MAKGLVVPVPIAAGAEALDEDERHSRLDQPSRCQAIGAVARRAVTVAHLRRLAGKVEHVRRLHQPGGPGEALFIRQGWPRLAAFEELLAKLVAQSATGLEALIAHAILSGRGREHLAVAGELHQVVFGPEAAGSLERGV